MTGFSRVRTRELTNAPCLYGVVNGTAAASKALVLDANKAIGTITTLTATNATITNLTATNSGGSINSDLKKCTTQTDTITTVLANITGLTGQVLVAGATYRFRCVLPGTCDTTSGVSYGFKYTTATLTSIESTGLTYTSAAVAVSHSTTATDQALLVDTTGVRILTILEGTMVVNAGGTVALQVGTHTGTTTASVYAGATMEFVRIS